MYDEPVWVVMTRQPNGIENHDVAMFEEGRDAFVAALQHCQSFLKLLQNGTKNEKVLQEIADLAEEVAHALSNHMSSLLPSWFAAIYYKIREFNRGVGTLFDLHVSRRYLSPQAWTPRRRVIPGVLRALQPHVKGTVRPQDGKHDVAAGKTKLESAIYYPIQLDAELTNIEAISAVVDALKGQNVSVRIVETLTAIEIQHYEDENPPVVALLTFPDRPPGAFTKAVLEGPPPPWQEPEKVEIAPWMLATEFLDNAPVRVLIHAAGFALRTAARYWLGLSVTSQQPQYEENLRFLHATVQGVNDWLHHKVSARDTAAWERLVEQSPPVTLAVEGHFIVMPRTCDPLILMAARNLAYALRNLSTAEEFDGLGDRDTLEAAGIVIRSPLRTGTPLLHESINQSIATVTRAITLSMPPPSQADGAKVPAAQSKAQAIIDQMWAEWRETIQAGEPYSVGAIDTDSPPTLKLWEPEE